MAALSRLRDAVFLFSEKNITCRLFGIREDREAPQGFRVSRHFFIYLKLVEVLMFKSNKTPEERLLFWMKRAKQLERRLAKEKQELTSIREFNEICRKQLEEAKAKCKSIEDKCFQEERLNTGRFCDMTDMVIDLLKRNSTLQNRIEEYKSSEKILCEIDNLPDYGDLPPVHNDKYFDSIDSEITDLLLECKLFPGKK